MKLILLLLVFSLLSCKFGPNEPNITECGLFPKKTELSLPYFVCFPYNKPSFELSLDDALKEGFIGAKTSQAAEGKKHHEQLHIEIDYCD